MVYQHRSFCPQTQYKGSGSEMVWGSFTGEINGKGQTAEYSGEAEAASAGGGFVRASSGGAVTAQQGQVTVSLQVRRQ